MRCEVSTFRTLLRLLAAGSIVVVTLATLPATTQAKAAPRQLKIQTIPVVASATFEVDGQSYVTGEDGTATVPAVDFEIADATLKFVDVNDRDGSQALFQRFTDIRSADPGGIVYALFTIAFPVTFSYVDLQGETVDAERVSRLGIKSSTGVAYELSGDELTQPLMLPAMRVVPRPSGLEIKDIYYTVQEAMIDGTNTVNRSQQKFFPTDTRSLAVTTRWYRVRLSASDALFGFDAGDALLLRWPDGHQTSHPISDGQVDLPLLPRGEYEMRIDGLGLAIWRPVSVSRDQTVELELFSAADIGVIVLAGLMFVAIAIYYGQRRVRRQRERDTGTAALPDESQGTEIVESAPARVAEPATP